MIHNIIDNEGQKLLVLDYIIERKKADDLASSILDGRYNQQKYRLSDSKLDHIFYLIEGKATKSSVLPQSTIDSAIINTQIINKFKIKTTDSIHDTLKWIIKMNLAIETRFMHLMNNKNEDYLEFKYDYDGFCNKTSKSHITLKTLFGNMLRSVKGCGKEAVAIIIDKYPTIITLYKELNSFSNDQNRLDFLSPNKKFTKKKKNGIIEQAPVSLGLNKNLSNTLIHIFCDLVYPKVPISDRNEIPLNEEE